MRATVVAAAALVGAVFAGGASAAAHAPKMVEAQAVVARLRAGMPLLARNVVIRGTLDLRPLHTVDVALSCTKCELDGAFIAEDVVFRRPVNLSGTKIDGGVNAKGARFEQFATFGTPWGLPTELNGKVDFSLAVFDGLVSFDRVRLADVASFSLARFRSDADFVGLSTSGRAPTTFAGAAFGGAVTFLNAVFGTDVVFENAAFDSPASFRLAIFAGEGRFWRCDFRSRADFGQTTFSGPADFLGAYFGGDATFLGTTFGNRGAAGALSLNHAVAAGTLDFTGAHLQGLADFSSVVARSLSLKGAVLERGTRLAMSDVVAQDFFLRPSDVGYVETAPVQRRVLGLIELSAKNRGDLGLANEAHYRLRESAARGRWWTPLDTVFYRGVAGYLVRPWHPLLILIMIGLVAATARIVSRRARPGGGWTHAVLDTFALAGPRRDDREKPRALVRAETLVYRVLLVVALIALANSNPTLRQMFDALS
jgi:uncharacterized protein YjbI with pentapeptide repeats